jgi:hypothetical protein
VELVEVDRAEAVVGHSETVVAQVPPRRQSYGSPMADPVIIP